MNILNSSFRIPDSASKFVASNILLLLMLFSGSTSAIASGQISISPTRLVFEGRTRSASVTLINRGDQTSTFRVSFEHKRMTEDGGFETIKNARPGELFADQMIIFSPRQVVLPPGGYQVVRLALRPPPNLADGEYRARMRFSEVPEQANKSIQAQAGNQKGMTIKITPILGISIPVIVRRGVTSAEVKIVKATLTGITADKSKGLLTIEMNRTGNRSVYGDLVATYQKPNTKNGVIVSQMNGIAVYTPNSKRIVKIPIQAPAGISLDGGAIDIVFRTRPDAGDKVLAQGQVIVPPGK